MKKIGHHQKFWSTKKANILGGTILLPFLLLVVSSLFNWRGVGEFDTYIGEFVRGFRAPWLTDLFTGITHLGDFTFIVILLLTFTAYFLIRKKQWQTPLWYILTVALGAGLLNQLMKFLFQRPRPDEVFHLVEQGGYSFPSGHSMGSMITYGALLFLVFQFAKTPVIRWLAVIVLCSLILLIGYSRVYLGVHYPSDIIGGFSLGAAWLVLCFGFYRQQTE